MFNTECVLGIDYSYEETGFAIVTKEKVLYVSALNFENLERKYSIKLSHGYRRLLLREKIKRLLNEYSITMIMVERVRLFSQRFVSLATTIALGELVAAIVDATFPNQFSLIDIVPVYSVETRVWKKRVLGKSVSTKQDAIKYTEQLRALNDFQELGKPKKSKKDVCYNRVLTHNEADAVCIAEFCFASDAERYSKIER